MTDTLLQKVNDAADALADAKAMVWAVFYIVQGMANTEEANALTGCCNQALGRLTDGADILVAVADQERKREGR